MFIIDLSTRPSITNVRTLYIYVACYLLRRNVCVPLTKQMDLLGCDRLLHAFPTLINECIWIEFLNY